MTIRRTPINRSLNVLPILQTISIDGEIVQKLISCHPDIGTFTYFVNGRWINDRTVPRDILYAPEIPESERRYVLGVMATLGRSPS